MTTCQMQVRIRMYYAAILADGQQVTVEVHNDKCKYELRRGCWRNIMLHNVCSRRVTVDAVVRDETSLQCQLALNAAANSCQAAADACSALLIRAMRHALISRRRTLSFFTSPFGGLITRILHANSRHLSAWQRSTSVTIRSDLSPAVDVSVESF